MKKLFAKLKRRKRKRYMCKRYGYDSDFCIFCHKLTADAGGSFNFEDYFKICWDCYDKIRLFDPYFIEKMTDVIIDSNIVSAIEQDSVFKKF